jgi:hypothetical protein
VLGAFYSKLKPKEKILALAALTVIFVFAMDRIVLGPILSKMSVMDAEIEAMSETIRRNLRIISFGDSISKEHLEYRNYLYPSDRSEEEIIANHLHEIETLGNLQAVKVSNIQSGDTEENPVMRSYQVKIEGEGSLSNILTLMKLLGDSKYLFKITGYKLSPKSKDGSVMKYAMDISRILLTLEDEVDIQQSSADMLPMNLEMLDEVDLASLDRAPVDSPLGGESVAEDVEVVS